jgi:uncharacterized membrane protein
VNEDTADDARRAGEPVEPYRVLDTATRRRAAVVYIAMALLAAILIAVTNVRAMWLTAVVPLVLLAVVQFAGGWRMTVKDIEAIRIASNHASFDVGHGSATLGFRGLLAKPVWQVLVFAAGPAPDLQALVTVDALSGDVRGSYEEPVPVP